MDTKLTLKLDKSVIQRAKLYAKDQNVSLSKLVENYLDMLTTDKEKKITISPLVESLTGIVKLEEGTAKKSYIDYLSKKYS